MIDTRFKTRWDGTPVLSKREIETDVERILLDYEGGIVLTEPQPTPLDELTEFYYGLNMDFKSFSRADILGVSVFTNGSIDVLEDNIPKKILVRKDTIILSENTTNTGRSRFTHGHELGHFTFHQHLFHESEKQPTVYNKANSMQICYKVGHFLSSDQRGLQTQSEWMEWQADYFSACLLMPRKSIATYLRLNGYLSTNILKKHLLDILSQNEKHTLVENLSECYKTSKQATTIRLQELGYIS